LKRKTVFEEEEKARVSLAFEEKEEIYCTAVRSVFEEENVSQLGCGEEEGIHPPAPSHSNKICSTWE
jgi:hypothetical protein